MARKVCIIMGVGLFVAGVLGFVMPTFLGTHLSIAHTLIHLASGALALYFGLAGTMKRAKIFSIVFGTVYAFLGLAGFIAGTQRPMNQPH